MIDAPEEYGGLELDKATSMLAAEKIASAGSFSVTYSAHTGIGTLPLVYYGTKEQKEKYLEKIISGEWIAAYCLTEPDSGSDALGAKATATLSAGREILPPERHEAVHHERQLCQPLYHLRQDRQGALHRVPRGKEHRGAVRRGRGEKARDQGFLHDARSSSKMPRCPVENVLGRSAKGTRSRSTS